VAEAHRSTVHSWRPSTYFRQLDPIHKIGQIKTGKP